MKSHESESAAFLRHSGRPQRSKGDPESRKRTSYREILDPGSRPVSRDLAGMTNCVAREEVVSQLEKPSFRTTAAKQGRSGTQKTAIFSWTCGSQIKTCPGLRPGVRDDELRHTLEGRNPEKATPSFRRRPESASSVIPAQAGIQKKPWLVDRQPAPTQREVGQSKSRPGSPRDGYWVSLLVENKNSSSESYPVDLNNLPPKGRGFVLPPLRAIMMYLSSFRRRPESSKILNPG